LVAKLEAPNKALAEERSYRQVTDWALQAAQESNAALTRDLQVVQASTTTLTKELEATRTSAATANQELSSKSDALEELVIPEWATQDKLQVLSEEKRLQEQVLESTQKMLSERDYSSSTVISLAVAHVVALLKSYVPNLYPELLRKDYPFEDDDEWDTLIDSVYDTIQYFVSQYDFSVVNDQGDGGSLGAQS
jgi:chromosome segregation ATPase